jgi:hypothetical protein
MNEAGIESRANEERNQRHREPVYGIGKPKGVLMGVMRSTDRKLNGRSAMRKRSRRNLSA